MNSFRCNPSSMRGFGILDVLISLLVLATGLLALAKFQGDFFGDSSYAKTRSVATRLAQEVLNELRAFKFLDTDADPLTISFEDIVNNAGGNIPATTSYGSGACTDTVDSNNLCVGNVFYTRTWNVTNYYICANATAPTTTVCNPPKADYPDFKMISVTVSWQDQEGTNQSITMEGTIHATNPTTSISASNAGGDVKSPPNVGFKGFSNASTVDLGGGQLAQSSSPETSVIKQGSTVLNTLVTFTTVKYDSTDGDRVLIRRDYANINCACVQSNPDDSPDDQLRLDGTYVSKSNEGTADGNDQHDLCNQCCRDHHDYDDDLLDSTEGDRYDPFRPEADYSNSSDGPIHNHYFNTGSGYQSATSVGDDYHEACRFLRVDGYWRVIQDWRMVKLNVFPESYVADMTAYNNYAKEWILWWVLNEAGENAGAEPAKPGLPDTSTLTLAVDGTSQWSAWGIYVDYLTAEELDALAARILDNDETVLQDIPFDSLVVMKLANWISSASNIAMVVNENIVDEATGESNYTRGLITGLDNGPATVTVTSQKSTTGITSTVPLDEDDAIYLSDTISVTVVGSVTISGDITGTGSKSGVSFTVTGVDGDVCGGDTTGSGAWSCSVPSGWSGTITPVRAGQAFSPSSRTFTNVTSDINGSDPALPTDFVLTDAAATTYTITGSITGSGDLSGVTFSGTGLAADACTTSDASGAYSCTVTSGWSGTITPAKSGGYTFNPTSNTYVNVNGNDPGEDFALIDPTGYTISGTVSGTGDLSGTTFTASGLSNACTTSTVAGAYSCSVTSGWSGTITPFKLGYSFVNSSTTYTNVAANTPNQNYTQSSSTRTISGSIIPKKASTGFVITDLVGGACSCSCTYTNTSPDGTYSCSVPNGWTGTITPTKGGVTFDPTSRSFNSPVESDQSANFNAN